MLGADSIFNYLMLSDARPQKLTQITQGVPKQDKGGGCHPPAAADGPWGQSVCVKRLQHANNCQSRLKAGER